MRCPWCKVSLAFTELGGLHLQVSHTATSCIRFSSKPVNSLTLAMAWGPDNLCRKKSRGSCLDGSILGDDSRATARRVQQSAVHGVHAQHFGQLPAVVVAYNGVVHPKPLQISCHTFQPLRVDLVGKNDAAVLHQCCQVRCFPTYTFSRPPCEM